MGVVFALHQGKDEELAWRNLQKNARDFTRRVGVDLLEIATNYNHGLFPGLKYAYQTAFASSFLILSLQKLFKVYYIASGYSFEDFKLEVDVSDDTEHYAHLLFPLLSLPSTSIRLEAPATRRIEKVRRLSTTREVPWINETGDLLKVCLNAREDNRNCGLCWKCRRTILELKAVGGYERFAPSFDDSIVKDNARLFYLTLLRGRRLKDRFLQDVESEVKKRGVSILPQLMLKDMVWVAYNYWVKDVAHNLKHRLLHRSV